MTLKYFVEVTNPKSEFAYTEEVLSLLFKLCFGSKIVVIDLDKLSDNLFAFNHLFTLATSVSIL